MVNRVVVGTHWGDEGKGKVVCMLTEDADIIARFNGGANAGHEAQINGKTIITHLVPTGIISESKQAVIGAGVVLDVKALMNEFVYLKGKDISYGGRFFIDNSTALILPQHRIQDYADEKVKERGTNRKIGTTGRGIGPAYVDVTDRSALRVEDLLSFDRFEKKFQENLEKKLANMRAYGITNGDIIEILEKITEAEQRSYQNSIKPHLLDYTRYFDEAEGLNSEEMLADFFRIKRKIQPLAIDTSRLLNQAINQQKSILFEGAQGTFLDVNYGTVPYVTSSHTLAGSACVGLGVGPTCIDEVIGVTKAITSRVGSGPFPTEMQSEEAERIRTKGQEFGATTGRPRRVGYFDGVMLKRAVQLNGITDLIITKLDIMSGEKEVNICTLYSLNIY